MIAKVGFLGHFLKNLFNNLLISWRTKSVSLNFICTNTRHKLSNSLSRYYFIPSSSAHKYIYMLLCLRLHGYLLGPVSVRIRDFKNILLSTFFFSELRLSIPINFSILRNNYRRELFHIGR